MNRYIIDVRESQEYSTEHVEGSINISPSELMSGSAKLADISKNAEIILYCVSGSRSNVSKNIMQSMGYTNVVNGINKHQVASKYNLKLVR